MKRIRATRILPMGSLHRLTKSAGSGTGSGSGSDHGTTTPQLVINHYNPGNGATNVDGSQSIVLSFNENVEEVEERQ